MKWILALVMLLSGGAAGYCGSRRYVNRIEAIEGFIRLFRRMESEIQYRRDPLPVLFYRVAEGEHSAAGRFLRDVTRRLYEGSDPDLFGIWDAAVEDIFGPPSPGFPEADRILLRNAGKMLGSSPTDDHVLLFRQLQADFEKNREDAVLARNTRGQTEKFFLWAGTAMCVILLL